jgi:hypothetical protein
MEPLSARNLAKYGIRRGAYNGACRRRFVLFHPADDPQNEKRSEFDTKRERDEFAARVLTLETFRSVVRGYKFDATHAALCSVWWFVENVPYDDPARNDIFFELREMVRRVA